MGRYRSFKPRKVFGGRPLTVGYVDAHGRLRRRLWDERDWLSWLVSSDDPSRGIIAARELRRAIEVHELRHVRAARERGWGWEDVAFFAGLARQTVHEKFSRRLRPAHLGYPDRMSLDDLYREVILDHYRSPRNKRPLEAAAIDVHRNNPLCGDDITVRVSVRDGVATDAAFEGQGCSISQASASMMTEQIKGKKVSEIDGLVLSFRAMMGGEEGADEERLGDLVALKGVVKYPVRIKCAVLAWDALQEGISSFDG